jgi:hypothetical protein
MAGLHNREEMGMLNYEIAAHIARNQGLHAELSPSGGRLVIRSRQTVVVGTIKIDPDDCVDQALFEHVLRRAYSRMAKQ